MAAIGPRLEDARNGKGPRTEKPGPEPGSGRPGRGGKSPEKIARAAAAVQSE